MRNGIKIILILFSVLLGGMEIMRRVAMLSSPDIQLVSLIAYAGLITICLLSLAGAGWIVRDWLRWSLAGVLAAGSLAVDGYQWAVGDFMTYDAFVTMTQSAGNLGDALSQQMLVMALAAIKAGLLFIGIGLKPLASIHLSVRAASFCVLPVMLLVTVLLFFRGGEGGSGLPSSHLGVSFTALHTYEAVTRNVDPREPVSIGRIDAPVSADIVLIIDESIAGNYLDINDPDGVHSGLADPREGIAIYNFGLAASITHCSVGSNVSLRFGGTRANYQETARSKPSIWAYAARAGLETIYIDAQRTGGTYQNQMNDEERALIDHWDQFDEVAVINRDQAVADQLAEYLRDDQPQFILVNKVGAHFPVNDKFPDSHARYAPMLERGRYPDVTDMAGRDELDGRAGNWLLYRNSYRNSLTWNVGAFFDRLLGKAGPGKATIIYTSDHGQHLHEVPDSGTATHCTPNPEGEEGVVPLVVIDTAAREPAAWLEAAASNHDKLSHYRIFPTLLGFMGYQSQATENNYGPDLLSAEPDALSFNIRYNARLGSDPIWQSIVLKDIARPPRSDYRAEIARNDQPDQ